MPTIRCVAAYAEGDVFFTKGQEVHAHEEEAARLMRGAPSSWEVVDGEVRLGGPEETVNYAAPEAPAPTRARGATNVLTSPRVEVVDDGDDGEVESDDIDGMTVAQLRELAAEKGVDLAGATNKMQIIAALERADV